ncbi:hypothetical protein [Mycolicibacterium brisbanense]|uniref:Transmembrane protein n=1 Tax=Mycolicibacterium brisbanense TaxID=146020 RepID=A0A100W3H8_9MYCO|nr:hypothetical protein [Mycolicibacterium brisbanense]MCV7158282.1 hypothetical protein [Mycolicibacterium brisbanense]GAS90970.1 uncharacterized protein RMCB_5066 [Mycolicibacterium brisbanense]
MTQTYLADHTLLLALPAFVPAVVVVGVIVYIARRDRRNPDTDAEAADEDETRGSTGEDDSP